MASKKKGYHPEFRRFAQHGDELLNDIVRDWVDNSKGARKIRPSLFCEMVSNEVISTFDIPSTFHRLSNFTNVGVVGDMVEAYIWFLNINYGTATVKRYLKKEYNKYQLKLITHNL